MICFCMVGILSLTGCTHKGDDGDFDLTGKTYKFTVKATGVLAADVIEVRFVGTPADPNVKTTMKVDGVVQSNQYSVELTKAQITKSSGVVVESSQPIFQMGFTLGGNSGTANHTFTVKIDPIVNGTAMTSISKTFTTDVFAQTYTY